MLAVLTPTLADERSSQLIPVGLGEVKLALRAGEMLVAYGVGSCIILCAWCPAGLIGGMAHVVLPSAPEGALRDGRYADRAVPLLLEQLEKAGALRSRLVVKMAGGACVLGPAAKPDGDTVGRRNVRAVRDCLVQQGLRLAASDVGGEKGRTVSLDVARGTVTVKKLGLGETSL